jgi:hypothetical protein
MGFGLLPVYGACGFTRFARRARITDAELCEAVSNIERAWWTLIFGGGVIKQRIARKGGGKSGGFRALILLRMGEWAFFVSGSLGRALDASPQGH